MAFCVGAIYVEKSEYTYTGTEKIQVSSLHGSVETFHQLRVGWEGFYFAVWVSDNRFKVYICTW